MTDFILRPSSAARRVACPGSRELESRMPKIPDTELQLEGTAAHWVAQEILQFNRPPSLGSVCPNGELVTQDMLEGAVLYMQEIVSRNILPKHKWFETKLLMKSIHSQCEGTPDFFGCNLETGHLIIIDYKFGYREIEVFENYQLLEYVIGAHDFLRENLPYTDFIKIDSFELVIVQPRLFKSNNVKNWVIGGVELDFYQKLLIEAEAKAALPNQPCTPSPQCSLCNARISCSALQASAINHTEIILEGDQLLELTDGQLGNEVKYLQYAAKIIEARKNGLETEAIARIKKGKRVPHFLLRQDYGHEKWRVSEKEVIEAGELMGFTLQKPVSVVTPTQARKLKVPQKWIDAKAGRDLGELKLVPQDAKSLQKIFNNGENNG